MFTFDGGFTQFEDSDREIELAGKVPVEEHDVLEAKDDAVIMGGIVFRQLDDYQPEVGDRFTFLTANNVSGEFSYIAQSGFGEDLTFNIEYDPDSVTAVATTVPQRSYEA